MKHVIVDEALKNLLSKVGDCPAKMAAIELLQHKRYKELVTSTHQYLSYFDLWPKNLLIETKKDLIKVRIIDFDTFFGPKHIANSCFVFILFFGLFVNV